MSGRVSSVSRNSPSTRLVGGLTARRHLRRRRILFAVFILAFLFLCAVIYGLWQPGVRVSLVEVQGTDVPLATIAKESMQGNYFGIIPRDSIFFFSAARIRADISTAYPDIVAVSIFRNGFSGISITANNRVPIARWCGAPPDVAGISSLVSVVSDCYFFDANGFVYAATSTTQPLNSFTIYESLSASEEDIIGSTLPHAEKFPAAFDFARQLTTLGSPISFIIFRNDEVDDYFESGVRVTYLLGDEQNAFTALISAKAQINLSDPTLKYIDVRFPGKIYLKRVDPPQ